MHTRTLLCLNLAATCRGRTCFNVMYPPCCVTCVLHTAHVFVCACLPDSSVCVPSPPFPLFSLSFLLPQPRTAIQDEAQTTPSTRYRRTCERGAALLPTAPRIYVFKAPLAAAHHRLLQWRKEKKKQKLETRAVRFTCTAQLP